MTNFLAIADVGNTLVELIRDNIQIPIARDSIALMSPAEVENGENSIRLTLYLYQIAENMHLRNLEIQQADPSKLNNEPLVLDLFYMLTSHPVSTIQDRTERTMDEQRVLCRAMQVLHDNKILKGTVMKDNLSDEDEPLNVTPVPMSLDDMTKIWTTFQNRPFKPSVCYLVTPVVVRSQKEFETKRVEVVRKEYYLPGEHP